MRRVIVPALALLATGAAPDRPVAVIDWFTYSGADPIDRAVTPGPDDYRNPILQGYYPDPSIVRMGEDYYLVNSTFAYFPGLPIFHSRDLVSWTQIGNAIDREGQFDFRNLRLSRAIFAPDLTYHQGVFYLAGTCVDCGGNFVMTAKNPAGPWSDPVWNKVDGIDPSLFVDTEGQAWLLNNGPPQDTPRYDGHRAIWIQRIDLKTLQPFGPRKVLIDGGVHPEEKPVWIEGPHLYRHEGYYYLSAAEGGTSVNHSQTIWRSKQVDGPYVPAKANPILTQRDLPEDRKHPITSAGHADLVTTPDGKWWAVFLATRPYQGDYYNIGRETFLLPVTWRDGWPNILAKGKAIPWTHKRPALKRQPQPALPTNGAFSYRDDFSGDALAQQWIGLRGLSAQWASVSGGALRLTPRPVSLGSELVPSYAGRRLQHHHATVSIRLHFADAAIGDRAGLAIVQSETSYYALDLARTEKGYAIEIRRRAGADEPMDGTIVATRSLGSTAPKAIGLRLMPAGATIRFAYSLRADEWQQLGGAMDATVLSTKSAGGFVGSTVGPFATSTE
ncbi:glycoside hydrolase family 43 protein [Stakelama pacifica]|uniref:Alpha-N-arabinofuranosidase n=1 Tax=Stakelama pacifica TaxID=517720 RepID=A0A4R6FY90_9SPHN|nr:glycoside hydrolase family 43 protein [Stakelama pacifica]TDN86921.1 alpha-N-arabinofuranosidase [Stakelama pacifica]GGO91072.1 glycoside hydrolase 43 family protein [Stakelama pacifica]